MTVQELKIVGKMVQDPASDQIAQNAQRETEGVQDRLDDPRDDQARSSPKTADDGSKQHSDAGSHRHRSSLTAARLLIKALLPIVVLAIAYASYKYLVSTAPETRKRPTVERSFVIDTITAEVGTYQPTLTLYGTTVAGRQIDIRALVAGRVIAASPQLREGGAIDKDETLLEIDPFDYQNTLQENRAQFAEARARITELEASIAMEQTSLAYAREQQALAEKDLERATPLVKRGTVSARTADDRRQILSQRRQAASQIENNISVWNARIAQQRATISRLEANIQRGERRLAETKLKAPFNAYVSDVSSQLGRIVSANDKVATLIDRDWIDARFTMTDEQFGRIVSSEGALDGRDITVEWILGNNTFTYPAKIEHVAARVSSTSGGVEIYARITAPNEPIPLRPGAFIAVRVPDKEFANVYRLPNTSLYDGDTVYVVKNQRLQSRKVKVVSGDGTHILVAGDLKSGDQVLSTRVSTPGDGVRVKTGKAQ